MAQLIVGMTPALASALARGVRNRDTSRLHHLTHSARLDLKPQHVRSLDPLGAPTTGEPGDDEETVWFWAETSGDDHDGDLGAALLAIPGVTAAYVKPPDGPP